MLYLASQNKYKTELQLTIYALYYFPYKIKPQAEEKFP